ncbi:MAG: kelch repeat-containing protein [Bacteroidota bacterium]
MMKQLTPTLILLFFCSGIFAQAGMWTWVKGDTTENAQGNFGTQGVEAPTNTPPGIYEAAEWTDLNGNFWLFGGRGNPYPRVYNTLWMYDPVTNNWKWVKGSAGANGSGTYGIPGVPDILNTPSARGWGVATWTDLNGDLWLFGGSSATGRCADLWRYNIATNMWTWMEGTANVNSAGVYGTQGISSPNSYPASRDETSATWVDADNNLWLFGGFNYTTNADHLNDVWKYNTSTNQWTWMKGSNLPNRPNVYGTKGVPDPLNTPGARQPYCTWTDANGDFWLFGGSLSPLFYNDVWRYQPTSNNWTWISGTDIANHLGNYGPLCSSSVNYCPSARKETRARWKDSCDRVWLYGGVSFYRSEREFNDLWIFNPSTLQWTLVKGDSAANVPAVFGTRGIAANANTPGGRSGSAAWKDSNGNLFLFGGSSRNANVLNDVWKFVIDTTCAVANCGTSICNLTPPDLNINNAQFCPDDSAQLCAPSGFVGYLWNNGQSGNCIATNLSGSYQVTVTDNTGCTAESIPQLVISYPLSPFSINVNGDTLSVFNTVTQQWLLNGSPIPNAVDTIYITNLGGSYTVAVTDTNGCVAVSSPVLITGIDNVSEEDIVHVFPNPSQNSWQLSVGSKYIGGSVELTDVNGRLLFQSLITNRQSQIAPEISKGIYLLRISSAKTIVVRKLIRL